MGVGTRCRYAYGVLAVALPCKDRWHDTSRPARQTLLGMHRKQTHPNPSRQYRPTPRPGGGRQICACILGLVCRLPSPCYRLCWVQCTHTGGSDAAATPKFPCAINVGSWCKAQHRVHTMTNTAPCRLPILSQCSHCCRACSMLHSKCCHRGLKQVTQTQQPVSSGKEQFSRKRCSADANQQSKGRRHPPPFMLEGWVEGQHCSGGKA